MKNYPAFSLVIGDIDELSDMSESIHHRLGAMLTRYGFRKIYLIGDMSRYIKSGYLKANGIGERIMLLDYKKALSDLALEIISGSLENEIILFKASRKMRLELIIDEIKRRCEA